MTFSRRHLLATLGLALPATALVAAQARAQTAPGGPAVAPGPADAAPAAPAKSKKKKSSKTSHKSHKSKPAADKPSDG